MVPFVEVNSLLKLFTIFTKESFNENLKVSMSDSKIDYPDTNSILNVSPSYTNFQVLVFVELDITSLFIK